MKFYHSNGKWLPDRRKRFSFNRPIDENEIPYDPSRRKIDRQMLLKKELTISNSFSMIGIDFKFCIIGESIIINHYNTQDNIKDIQNYVNQIQKQLYAIVFEDDSFVVYETNKIKLFYNEHDTNIMMNCIKNFLLQNNYKLEIKQILITPDE